MSGVNRLFRRVSALLIAVVIVALIAYDLVYGRGFALWWDKHAITTSLVSDLLIVGATALIFDEVQAYRQRKERSWTVAAQGMIVYAQAREAYQAVVSNISDPSADNGVPDELQDLASNLLTASPSLFDDRQARDFLLNADRLMATLFATANGGQTHPASRAWTDRLTQQMNLVQSSFQPLVDRLPPDYQRRISAIDSAIDTDSSSDPNDPGSNDPGSNDSGSNGSNDSGTNGPVGAPGPDSGAVS
jgi:hypothetical protein